MSVDYPSRDGVVRAVENVSLQIAKGSFTCIVGPSGCGKSTLLQVIGGFIRPSRGDVRLMGASLRGPGADRGIVFQQPTLFPWATVWDNASFGPRVRGVAKSDRDRRVSELLETVGLLDFRNRYPYQLSGGMQHRLAIVRAIVNDPMVLLMDEPFASLDALTREHMQVELRSIWIRTGMTVLFVTHSVEEAVYLGTEVVAMSARPGRLIGRFDLEFTHRAGHEDSRSVKSSPDFVKVREQVLGLIWEPSEQVAEVGEPRA